MRRSFTTIGIGILSIIAMMNVMCMVLTFVTNARVMNCALGTVLMRNGHYLIFTGLSIVGIIMLAKRHKTPIEEAEEHK